jgi:hypothetical protein
MDGGVGWLPHHLSFRGEELKRKVMGILWEPSNLVRDLLHRDPAAGRALQLLQWGLRRTLDLERW